MLASLKIDNFTLVKQLELDFSRGMTTFTGETGAGKSIMIDALMLALGGRADSSVVRPGSEKCEVSATFLFAPNADPAKWLASHDLDSEQNEIVLRRIIYAEGRSKSTINGQPFPLQKVKELSELLVHIHGQHQHQTLMHHATHRQQLDQYAGHHHLVEQVYSLYLECQSIKRKLDSIQQLDEQQDKIALLEFHIQELSAMDLKEGEIEQLNEQHQQLHHAQDYLNDCQQLLMLLQHDDGSTICTQLNSALQILRKMPQSSSAIKNSMDMLASALIQCEEACDEIESFSTHIQLDPEQLNRVELRLSALHHAARKYHVETHQLPAHLQKLKDQLESITQGYEQREQLDSQYRISLANYQKAAHALRESRQSFAQKLGEDISKIIQQLGMPKGYLTVQITPLESMQAHGMDKVEYKVCTNPGMSPDALGKIASGGELSRISLAIQMITAQRGATPTLLFDEVDVGIGGATAALVGRLLKELSQRLQIFCVTHQAQVAASAQHHFLVEKYTDKELTYSTITPLNSEQKIHEIARMLSGLTITEQTLCHAKEMLAEASIA